ncbi:MAG: hypothetical protein JWO56_3614, partial [Acidobacteria bacterium]|nr:hypothetical protein [Acidobacteriota bacterium]
MTRATTRSFLLLAILAAFTSAAMAADAPPAKKAFPDDYKPSPCAPANSCQTFERSTMPSAAFKFLGLKLDTAWMAAHGDEMVNAFEPICRKQATCLATPGNLFAFCNDIISTELRDVCDERFPRSKDAYDWEQCSAFMETFELGVDQRTQAIWNVAQACANERTPAVDKTTPLIWWITPSPIAPDYGGYLQINAVDPDTRVPIQADVAIEGQIIYVATNPIGSLQTYYPFHWKPKFTRVQAANGHSELTAPTVTIKAKHYPDIKFAMPVTPRKLILDLVPPAAQLHPGKNT